MWAAPGLAQTPNGPPPEAEKRIVEVDSALPKLCGREQESARKAGRAARRAALGGLAVTSAFAIVGCDSTVGIPQDDAPSAVAAVSTPAAAVPTTAPTTTTPAVVVPTSGTVRELPQAVQRWADDLPTSTVDQLKAKCWTIAPRNVADMYGNEQAILAALAQPGTATPDGVTWQNRSTTVTVERAALDTDYACPRVATGGAEIEYNDADARHTVRRYLARFVGKPLDPADEDGTYPLVCKATPAAWDPSGTGKPVAAPLANNPGKLTGATEFADQEISSKALRGDYLAVDVPVTNSSGVTQTRTFTVLAGPQGYCIGDVSS
ncbi:hypothetical protein NBRGN_095_00220 [Nocardia brasiliensis NBRC 14402]|nr:hypothetical protein CEQ30_28935 [Nocardia brasiliensis]GAJ85502.1 hypothetical protein NBRGN_095_00220 [Nocardia brasiliensis NBRC 14402]SUB10713.1 Uncharacterised protein [Nocardia brasiliensis]